jgi:sialidase-1
VYSDDGGISWKIGDNVPDSTGIVNECQVVELSDGRVLLNSRQMGGKAVRKTSISNDGGQTWSPVEDAPDLIDPRCMGSILRLKNGNLLYSGPRSTKRENGTIYLSTDDGQTWLLRKTLEPNFFAYSSLVELPNGTIGCLFEANDYNKILFAHFSRDWLIAP